MKRCVRREWVVDSIEREARGGEPVMQEGGAKPSEADTGSLRIAYQGSQVWSAERATCVAQAWEQAGGVSSARCWGDHWGNRIV
jgi:hypothetical protein